MIESSPFVKDLALILILASLVLMICKYLKQPLVLGYLLVGFLVGPNFPFMPTITDMTPVKLWAEIGIIFLLFTLGFNFSFKKLLDVGPVSSIIAILKNLLMFLVGFIIAYLFNWKPMTGIFIGAILSITSTIVVARSLEDQKKTQENYASILMGMVIVEDLIVLIIMILISSLGQLQSFSSEILAMSILKKVLFITLIMLLTFSLPKIFFKVRKLFNHESILIFSLAFCLLMANLGHLVGLSPALGAFIAGMLLSETTDSSMIKELISPIRDLFVAIFFVSVGMMISLKVIMNNLCLIIGLSLVMIFIKSLITCGIALLCRVPRRDAIALGITSIPIGEFSFVLASVGISMNYITQDFYSITVTLSALSILMTTYSLKFFPLIKRKILRKYYEP